LSGVFFVGKKDEILYPLRLGDKSYDLVKPFGSEFSQLVFSFSIMMSYLRDFPKEGLILDVGAGSGWTTEWITRCGFKNVFWMDISKFHVEVLKERMKDEMRAVVGDMEYSCFEGGSFDCVFCFDALHHSENPQKAVNEFFRVGRKSLILNEPSRHHESDPKSIEFSKEYGVVEKGFSIQQLHKMLKKAGYSTIIIRPADLPPPLFSRKKLLNLNLFGVPARDVLYNTPVMYASRLLNKGLIVYAEK